MQVKAMSRLRKNSASARPVDSYGSSFSITTVHPTQLIALAMRRGWMYFFSGFILVSV